MRATLDSLDFFLYNRKLRNNANFYPLKQSVFGGRGL